MSDASTKLLERREEVLLSEIYPEGIGVCQCVWVTDPFDLQRYLDAQAGMYSRAVADLRMGGNRALWIWLVFPQMKELGDSPLSIRLGIRSLSEARAYAIHPVLGERLRECCRILLENGSDIDEMFGEYDAMRIRSCMTLFIAAADDNADFKAVLNMYPRGEFDSNTMDFIAKYP